MNTIKKIDDTTFEVTETPVVVPIVRKINLATLDAQEAGILKQIDTLNALLVTIRANRAEAKKLGVKTVAEVQVEKQAEKLETINTNKIDNAII